MNQPKLSAARARELLAYDPETGSLTWKVSRGGVRAGAPAGCVNSRGYVYVRVDGTHELAHRVAWLLHTGLWPRQDIDHVNGSRADNRICNLRDCSHKLNVQNQRSARSHSAMGLLGVSPKGRRFRATICSEGRQRHLGTFATPEEAHQAYLTAKRQLHAGCTI